MSAQLALFESVPQARRSRETLRLHSAILALRSRGYKVFRVGRAHKIIGRGGACVVDSKRLLKLAEHARGTA